jgi:tetratricopeptide (TPR) repeat protein
MIKSQPQAKNAEKARMLFSEGLAHHQAGRLDDASLHYRQILQIIPRQANALHMLGLTEFQKNNFPEAVTLISQARELSPENYLIYFNLGNALRACGRIEEASNAYSKAALIQPSNLEALKNLGNTYKELNRIQEAINCYDKILSIDPTHSKTKLNKAIALLTDGHLAEGWDLYDYRLDCDTPDKNYIGPFNLRYGPSWDGTPMDKPLLVLPEQGLGDQIFYGRLLSDLQSNEIDSLVCADGRLHELFRRSFPKLSFIQPTELFSVDLTTNSIGAQVHIGSLGRFYRRDFSAVKRHSGEFLISDNALAENYRARLPKDKLVCGLSWTSRNLQTGINKSIDLDKLRPILELPNVQFVNLQYGDTAQERQKSFEATGVDILNFEDIDNLADIDKLGALISACDVVLSVSNSTAHLAAAIGKPTLILLAHHTPLWYWHLDQESSPWYPTVSLIRQTIAGCWEEPLSNARQKLACIAQGI